MCSERSLTALADALETRLETLLIASPTGISEYALIHQLRDEQWPVFVTIRFGDPLDLFRSHFLLFHVLYRLRERWLTEQRAILDINPLCISWRPCQNANTCALAATDALRDYYLDFIHLEKTTTTEVQQLLDDFWRRLHAHEGRGAALTELGLQDPVNSAEIQQAYRRLAMSHHPDRGGNPERFARIRKAWEQLKPEY